MRCHQYLLLVTNGLQDLVLKELFENRSIDIIKYELLSNEDSTHNTSFNGVCGVGKILLHSSASPDIVERLRTVQSVLAFVVASSIISILRDDGAIDEKVKTPTPDAIAYSIVNSANWAEAVELHATATNIRGANVSYRASAIRDGAHEFKSHNVMEAMGYYIGKKHPAWSVSLTNFNLEVVCLIKDGSFVAGIPLLNRANISKSADTSLKYTFAKRRLASEMYYQYQANLKIRFPRTSTLRPSTAYMMLQLANVSPGDIALDTCTGIGTIPLYAATATDVFPMTMSIGAEINANAIENANLNYKESPAKLASFVHWDSTRLPLKDASVDKVVVDLPFGNRCGDLQQVRKIMPSMLNEMFRVLRPLGIAVLLVAAKKLIDAYLSKHASQVEIMSCRPVNIGGMSAFIYVLRALPPRMIVVEESSS